MQPLDASNAPISGLPKHTSRLLHTGFHLWIHILRLAQEAAVKQPPRLENPPPAFCVWKLALDGLPDPSFTSAGWLTLLTPTNPYACKYIYIHTYIYTHAHYNMSISCYNMHLIYTPSAFVCCQNGQGGVWEV